MNRHEKLTIKVNNLKNEIENILTYSDILSLLDNVSGISYTVGKNNRYGGAILTYGPDIEIHTGENKISVHSSNANYDVSYKGGVLDSFMCSIYGNGN